MKTNRWMKSVLATSASLSQDTAPALPWARKRRALARLAILPKVKSA